MNVLTLIYLFKQYYIAVMDSKGVYLLCDKILLNYGQWVLKISGSFLRCIFVFLNRSIYFFQKIKDISFKTT